MSQLLFFVVGIEIGRDRDQEIGKGKEINVVGNLVNS